MNGVKFTLKVTGGLNKNDILEANWWQEEPRRAPPPFCPSLVRQTGGIMLMLLK